MSSGGTGVPPEDDTTPHHPNHSDRLSAGRLPSPLHAPGPTSGPCGVPTVGEPAAWKADTRVTANDAGESRAVARDKAMAKALMPRSSKPGEF